MAIVCGILVENKSLISNEQDTNKICLWQTPARSERPAEL